MRSSPAFRIRRAAFASGIAIALPLLAIPLVVGLSGDRARAADSPIVASTGAGPGAGQTAPADLAALLAGFRRIPGLAARFEEEKTLALLAAPLTSRGRLYFAPPATLLRRVESPNPHDVLIEGDRVRIATFRTGSPLPPEIETIELAGRSEIRPLVESMLWIFSGDREQLESTFEIEYRVARPPQTGAWTLRLKPRREPLSRLIRELVIAGRGLGAERLEVFESSGDHSTTRILEADAHARFEPDALSQLFGRRAP